MPTLKTFAPYPPAGAAAYSTIVALQAAGMPERPAHALGAVALLAYLFILTALIQAVTASRTPARV